MKNQMANDMSSAMDMLQDLLSSPDAGEKISSMLSAFTGNSDDGGSMPDLSGIGAMLSGGGDGSGDNALTALSGLPMDSIMRLAGAYKTLNQQDDPRTNLLKAMRPYLQPHRHNNLDQAVKLLGLIKLMPLLGEFKGIL